jgi:hypothetical protein
MGMHVKGIVLAGLIGSLLLPGLPSYSSSRISWRVENNFRLLKKPADQEWLKSIAIQSKLPESATVKINDLRDNWKIVPPTAYDRSKGVYERGYVLPVQWSVRLSTSLAPFGRSCRWVVAGSETQGPCHDFVPKQPVGSQPLSVQVMTESGLSETTTIQVRDVLFLALGDSYASGEGNPDVVRIAPTRPADWWDRKCHRSLYSWPVMVAARYAAEHPQNSVTLINRTCSGAVMSDVLGSTEFSMRAALSQGGPGEKNLKIGTSADLPPQLALAHGDLCLGDWEFNKDHYTSICHSSIRQPDFLLLSIGGNDVEFSSTVIDAMLGRVNYKTSRESDDIELTPDRIANLKGQLAMLERQYPKLAKAIFQLFPRTSVLMTLYPDPLHLEPYTFCGRTSGGTLATRDDGIGSVDFTMNGGEEALARLTGFRISNKEVIAIYDDFYTRLNGRRPIPPANRNGSGKGSEIDLRDFYSRNEDYRGLRRIGWELENQYPGQWRLVSTQESYPVGMSPWENIVSSTGQPERQRDMDQQPCFRPRGYCVQGSTVTGRWFLTLDDSIDRLGNLYAAMHPNIYGHLYVASKVYQSLPGVNVPTDQLILDNQPMSREKCTLAERAAYGSYLKGNPASIPCPGLCLRNP